MSYRNKKRRCTKTTLNKTTQRPFPSPLWKAIRCHGARSLPMETAVVRHHNLYPPNVCFIPVNLLPKLKHTFKAPQSPFHVATPVKIWFCEKKFNMRARDKPTSSSRQNWLHELTLSRASGKLFLGPGLVWEETKVRTWTMRYVTTVSQTLTKETSPQVQVKRQENSG